MTTTMTMTIVITIIITIIITVLQFTKNPATKRTRLLCIFICTEILSVNSIPPSFHDETAVEYMVIKHAIASSNVTLPCKQLHSQHIRGLLYNQTVWLSWPKTGDFPHYWPFVIGIHRWQVDTQSQRPIMWSFGVNFFDVTLNKLLGKQPSCRQFGMP